MLGWLSPELLAAIALFSIVPPLMISRKYLRGYILIDAALWLPPIVIFAISGTPGEEAAGAPLIGYYITTRLLLFASTIWREGKLGEEGGRWGPVSAAIFTTLLCLVIASLNLRWPIDGDEPFYLLISESIVHDLDLDLSNQFDAIESSMTGRPDLEPQVGDVVEAGGTVRSHHEPFFPLLIAPGVLTGSPLGAVAVICLFAGALAWALARWGEECGVGKPSRTIGFLAFIFGPPVIYYAARLWPEIPAAFFFVQSLRALERRSIRDVALWALPMMLLKLRFVPVGVGLIVVALWLLRRDERVRSVPRLILLVALALLAPFAIMLLAIGSGTGVHSLAELAPQSFGSYLRGGAGLLVDAQSGLLFQAPLLLIGAVRLVRWRGLPLSVRAGSIALLPYLLLLLPRAEWHGGWSPPLRYLVAVLPLAAMGLMFIEKRLSSALLLPVVAWTAGLVMVGASWPWRLFQIADGEGLIGESISRLIAADFSRLLPSLVRPSPVAWIWFLLVLAILAAMMLAAGRRKLTLHSTWTTMILLFLVGGSVLIARDPGERVELEDTHVMKRGGELFPERWTVARFRFSGGWQLDPGDSVRFRIEEGPGRLAYTSNEGAVVSVDGHIYELTSANAITPVRVETRPEEGFTELTMIEGSATLDWIEVE